MDLQTMRTTSDLKSWLLNKYNQHVLKLGFTAIMKTKSLSSIS